MPLKIDLKPGEKFVLNGAVVSVGRDGRSLLLQNEAVLLREKDIMQEEDANTPARRIYFIIMLMYIDPANIPIYADRYQSLVTDLSRVAAAAPDFQSGLIKVIQDVAAGNFYHALRECRKLFEIENKLLAYPAPNS
jgi:flagellar protein FlbT